MPALPPSRPQTALARLFSEGFRAFFLAAAGFAVLAAGLWGLWLARGLGPFLPSAAAPADWHAHEMVFGYGGAVLAGIFLTAPSRHLPRAYFALLLALWAAGRVALALSALLPAALVAVIDLSFGLPVLARMAPPVLRRPKPQTLAFLGIFALHWGGDLAMHLDWMGWAPGWAANGAVLGLLACAVMNAFFGGRLSAAFTRNAMVRNGAAPLPHDSRLLNLLGPGLVAAAAVAIAAPEPVFGGLLLAAGAVNLARLARWRGLWALGNNALIAGFHLGFACLGLGLGAMGLAVLSGAGLSPQATHLLALGAVAGLSMAVMAKGALGQTGRPAQAGWALKTAGGLLVLATLSRSLGAGTLPSLVASSLLFSMSYTAFLIEIGAALLGEKRRAGSPGARPLRPH